MQGKARAGKSSSKKRRIASAFRSGNVDLGRNGFSQVRIPNAPPFPDIFVTKFEYSGWGLLTTGNPTPSFGELYYSMNSLYDPDFGAGGTQPYYRDQLLGGENSTSIPYGQYMVYACAVEATFMPSSANSIPTQVAVYPVPTITQDLPSLSPDLAQLPKSKTALLGLATAQEPVTIRHYQTIWEADGMPPEMHNGLTYWYDSTGNTSPAYQPLFGFASACVGSLQATNVYVHYKLTYYTKLYTRSSNIAAS